MVAIFSFLLYFSLPLFSFVKLQHVFSWSWQPFEGNFGILPMMLGSILLSVFALVLSYPLSLGICCYIHGDSHSVLRKVMLLLVQFMTSVPTVIYGFVAVFLLVPFLRTFFRHGTGFSILAAGLILSLLILPTIVLIMHSQFAQIEPKIRLTAKALGMSEAQKFIYIVFPDARKGLLTAAVLGFGRAVGDTLIPLMLAGNAVSQPESILDSIRTLTSHIALVVATDSQSDAYLSLFACGMVLFSSTIAVNIMLRWLAASPEKINE
ncbi:phosphate transport system permease protein [Halodesulfovibrio marinisediminis DSM 17456]|uniref:Phosphate transport system permease protein n=1 Tax=Halodesulfovibrio marinisediminis DSM 17456 TaxID=1121457 RepID=A0A1N6E7U4_9BACT|nr:phosphate transport system permease protein [Halodesulfovibrio marinisediminis DSM 17456]